MSKEIDIKTDARALRTYACELARVREKMIKDAEELSSAFYKAEWNDPVAEKTREALEEYVRALNAALGKLRGAADAAAELAQAAEEYESMA